MTDPTRDLSLMKRIEEVHLLLSVKLGGRDTAEYWSIRTSGKRVPKTKLLETQEMKRLMDEYGPESTWCNHPINWTLESLPAIRERFKNGILAFMIILLSVRKADLGARVGS